MEDSGLRFFLGAASLSSGQTCQNPYVQYMTAAFAAQGLA